MGVLRGRRPGRAAPTAARARHSLIRAARRVSVAALGRGAVHKSRAAAQMGQECECGLQRTKRSREKRGTAARKTSQPEDVERGLSINSGNEKCSDWLVLSAGIQCPLPPPGWPCSA